VAWPYHPRSGLGGLLIDCLVHELAQAEPHLVSAEASGELESQRGQIIGGAKRRKRIDLLLRLKDHTPRTIAVEAKVCMTAHSKARTRLVAELTSSLDAVMDADETSAFFAIVVVNYGERFTSPLNLPGPNDHGPHDASRLVAALAEGLSVHPELKSVLLLPLHFDNESCCDIPMVRLPSFFASEREFVGKILSSINLSPK
jgi:hypothetical protein